MNTVLTLLYTHIEKPKREIPAGFILSNGKLQKVYRECTTPRKHKSIVLKPPDLVRRSTPSAYKGAKSVIRGFKMIRAGLCIHCKS